MKKLLVILCTLFITTAAYAAAWQLSQAKTEYSKGQYAQALKTIDSAISSSNYTEAEAYKLRAQIKIKMNNHASAIEDLTTAINEDPTAEMYKIRAWANLKVGNYEQAYDDAMKIITVGGKSYIRDGIICMQAVINNNNTPAYVKYDAYDTFAKIGQKVCGRSSVEFMIPSFRSYQVIANASENDKIFEKTPKNELIEMLRNKFKVPNTKRDPNRRILIDNSTYPAKEIYADDLSEVPKELSYQERLSIEMTSGLLEYALGNKELGKKIVNGSINEIFISSPGDKIKENTWLQAIYTGIDSPKFDVNHYINGCSPANIK